MYIMEMAENMVRQYLKGMMLEPVEVSPHNYFADGTLKMSTCGFSVFASVKSGSISVLLKCPVKIKEEYAKNVILLLNSINSKIESGCLYYCTDSGEIFFRNDLSCEDETPSMADIEYLFQYPLCILHKFDGCIADCLSGCAFSEKDVLAANSRCISFKDAVFSSRLNEI